MKKRKIRRDRKYKYRKKHGKMQPYYSKRGRDDPLKIWWWREEKMPYESYLRIPAYLRKTARAIVYKKDLRVDVPYELLSNKKSVEELALTTLGTEGSYLLMMFCHRKNKFGVSPVKVARVIILQSEDGLSATMTHNYRLNKYWFWNKRK